MEKLTERDSTMKSYCVTFLWDFIGKHVALIQKNRPEWQAGKLNGIGGQIETNESPTVAARREFCEETGVEIPERCMRCFLVGSTYKHEQMIYFYTARFDGLIGDLELHQTTDEKPDWYEYKEIRDSRIIIPNLQWLLPMSLEAAKTKGPIDTMIGYTLISEQL